MEKNFYKFIFIHILIIPKESAYKMLLSNHILFSVEEKW